MIELRLAHEAQQRDLVLPLVQHLDDHVAPEQRLFTAIQHTGVIFADPLAQNELA
jgi:hypothetical protein